MAVIINASTSTGLVQSADTSGIIQFQSNGSTDALWKGGDAAAEMLAKVQAVKTKYPKGA